MMSAAVLFETYLACRVPRKDAFGPWKQAYESFSGLDWRTLEHLCLSDDHPGARTELGERYLFGVDGVAQDIDGGEALLRQGAALGDPEAYFVLSQLYGSDRFRQEDRKRYVRMLTYAAELGSCRGMYHLSRVYFGEAHYAESLDLARRAGECARELLEILLTRPCGASFGRFTEEFYDVFVYATCHAASQYLEGQGVAYSAGDAERLLSEAQEFHIAHFHAPCREFTMLMA